VNLFHRTVERVRNVDVSTRVHGNAEREVNPPPNVSCVPLK
jgi:hypothetical protein